MEVRTEDLCIVLQPEGRAQIAGVWEECLDWSERK